MADHTIDVIMRVVGADGDMAADSQTQFTTSIGDDLLREQFRPGFFCDLIDFDFSAGVSGGKSEKAGADKAAKPGPAPANQPSPTATQRVDMQPIEYTRIMDSSSSAMFKALVNSEILETVSIVKRKAAGVQNSGLCYLRLDFNQVLLTSINFKDEQQVMHESGTFIYRSMTIRYRPQLNSGSLGAVVSTSWKMPQMKKSL